MTPGWWETNQANAPVVGELALAVVVIVTASVLSFHVMGVSVPVGPDVPPQVTFSTTYEDGRLTVHHESGAKVERSSLSFVSAEQGELTAANGGVVSPFPPTVSSGDAAVLDVDRDDTVTVVWTAPGTDRSTVVLRWNGG